MSSPYKEFSPESIAPETRSDFDSPERYMDIYGLDKLLTHAVHRPREIADPYVKKFKLPNSYNSKDQVTFLRINNLAANCFIAYPGRDVAIRYRNGLAITGLALLHEWEGASTHIQSRSWLIPTYDAGEMDGVIELKTPTKNGRQYVYEAVYSNNGEPASYYDIQNVGNMIGAYFSLQYEQKIADSRVRRLISGARNLGNSVLRNI